MRTKMVWLLWKLEVFSYSLILLQVCLGVVRLLTPNKLHTAVQDCLFSFLLLDPRVPTWFFTISLALLEGYEKQWVQIGVYILVFRAAMF